MKYPWYSWLSIFGFFIQCVRTTWEIFFVKRPFKFSTWLSFVGKFLLLFFGIVLVPALVLMIVTNEVLHISKMAYNVFTYIVWIYIYFSGVFVTRKLYVWTNSL